MSVAARDIGSTSHSSPCIVPRLNAAHVAHSTWGGLQVTEVIGPFRNIIISQLAFKTFQYFFFFEIGFYMGQACP